MYLHKVNFRNHLSLLAVLEAVCNLIAAKMPSDAASIPALVTMLQKKLAYIGFSDWSWITLTALTDGDVAVFGVFFRYILQHFSQFTAEYMKREPMFVIEGDDQKLAVTVLKLMNKAFGYKAALSPTQIVKPQFFSAKVHIVLDMISLIQQEVKTQQQRSESRNLSACRPVSSACRNGSCPKIESSNDVVAMDLEKRIAELEIRRRSLNRAIRTPMN